MANSKKYGKPVVDPKYIKTPSTTMGKAKDGTLNAKIYDDGTFEVYDIKEVSSDGLSYGLNQKTNKFFFSKDLDANTQAQYIPKYVDKVYKSSVSYKAEVKEAYAVYKSEVKKLHYKTLDRYKTMPKGLKKEVDAIEKAKNQFIFTEMRGTNLWNKSYTEASHFGPYNYDVKLEVTKEIEFINDLIVIRTGGFNPSSLGTSVVTSGMGVAWVSPHQRLLYSGDPNYLLTGQEYTNVHVSGSGMTYISGVNHFKTIYHVTNEGSSHALSSRHITIPKGEVINSGLSYYNYAEQLSSNELLESPSPLFQDFYHTYDEYTDNFNIQPWDGIIPSGVPFTIESWSTNPKYLGFDGEITIKPTGASDPTCTYSGEFSGEAYDLDYQQSIRKALKQAKKKFHKKLNQALISKGIKGKGSKQKRYERLLTKVAQNVYDGLGYVRNEQIAKVQGLEANPIDSPVYYDGTIRQYRGSNTNADYDHSLTAEQREALGNTSKSVGSDIGGSSSSSSSSGGSSSGGGGGY